MASKKDNYGCATVIVVIVTVILFIYTFFLNALNFGTLLRFGLRQYGNNIIHLHRDYDCVAKNKFKVYADIMRIEEMDKEKPAVFDVGDIFELKGYISKGYVMWVAVSFFDGSKEVNAYAYIPKNVDIPTFGSAVSAIFDSGDKKDGIDNEYFRQLNFKELENYKEHYYGIFFDKVKKKIKLRKVTGSENFQKIHESSEFRIIPYIRAGENERYYCKRDEFEEVEKLYHMYLGKNYRTNLLNLYEYDPEIDGIYNESIFYRIIDSIYFKIIFVIILLVIPGVAFSRKTKVEDSTGNNQ